MCTGLQVGLFHPLFCMEGGPESLYFEWLVQVFPHVPAFAISEEHPHQFPLTTGIGGQFRALEFSIFFFFFAWYGKPKRSRSFRFLLPSLFRSILRDPPSFFAS